MSKELVPDALWREVEPLMPRHRPQRKGGRPYASDRDCLRGIIFVLKTGVPWQMLPPEAFGVSGSTCWRHFRDWTKAGVWKKLHRRLLNRLAKQGAVDLSEAAVDSASVRAVFGGGTPGRTPSIGRKTAVNAT